MTAWVLAALLHLAPWLLADEARLGELAEAISEAALTREEGMLLVSIAWHESGKTFENREGDSGHSRSVFQCWVCPGVLCNLVSTDVRFAARVAIARARASIARCRRVPGADLLSEYTSGACQRQRHARVRWRTMLELLEAIPAAEPSS